MSQDQGRHYSQLAFIKDHMFASFSAPKVDLTGRTVLVTGGNTGLGYAAVLHFARSNASRIIITSRSLQRAQAAAEQVHKDVPSYRGIVDVMRLDLASWSSTIAFCKALNSDPGRLDIIVANAGVKTDTYQQTADGYEGALQINGLATALMCLLCLPKLGETAGMEVPAGSKGMKPTLTIVASDVHHWAKFPQANAPGSLIEALNDPDQFISFDERYNVSKLLSIYNAREIAKLPAVTSGKVLVNSVGPGMVVSALRDGMGPFTAWLINAMSWSAEKGTRNFLWAATQPTAPGAYVTHCKETPPSLFIVSAKGKKTQEKYWRECLAIFRQLGGRGAGQGALDIDDRERHAFRW